MRCGTRSPHLYCGAHVSYSPNFLQALKQASTHRLKAGYADIVHNSFLRIKEIAHGISQFPIDRRQVNMQTSFVSNRVSGSHVAHRKAQSVGSSRRATVAQAKLAVRPAGEE